ncbi:MAG: hypothetical protein KIT84_09385 [Labilithrix sp.]|nr:hypothetical protein [Labilithrix sp.]
MSRNIAFAPWFSTAVVAREASAPIGTAGYRPTLIGLGIAAPLASPSRFIVPRLGVGYAVLWVHVWPDTAVAPAEKKSQSIDLFGAVMYVNAAISMKINARARITAEGMLGVSSHDLVVRMGDSERAHWGVPVAHLALRGELVIP